MKGIWCSALICFAAVNSLAAVLYAGVPALDDGGGFISLSPLVDCILGGAVIVLSGSILLISLCRTRKRDSGRAPRIPSALCFPAAYGVTLACLSAIVLLMGICQLLDWFRPVHLPFWGG